MQAVGGGRAPGAAPRRWGRRGLAVGGGGGAVVGKRVCPDQVSLIDELSMTP